MNEQAALYAILMNAIAHAQATEQDMKDAAEGAAKAFNAGLAAFRAASRPASE